ncbi:hypothetical protein W02_42380 [Nitrospira sp. KM1]|uniref:hypothetical protein n=1 Tax=Nitrospira sp. KM1 TaxID=1936990 RepID=UPI0013A797CA|nr:hypothetical protein [Nitrospira sp. KM1]BCA57098.1 hypothetical protein W02_42380 [Nitrospira sp. KM1]
MGLLAQMSVSWKSSRLHRLEKTIAPPHQRVSLIVAELMCVLEQGGLTEKDRAFEEFVDLCESDEGIRRIMEAERLTRRDLKGIVVCLMARGLGEWIKGHYVALSTIAYAEPLQYFLRAERRGVHPQRVLRNLLDYWEGRISPQELLGHLPADI